MTALAPSTTVTGPGRGIRARGHVTVGRGPGGRARLAHVHTEPPLGVRLAAGEVHLLGTAAGPMGGDDLALEVTLEPRTTVRVRSVAATVVLPGDGRPSRQDLAVAVATGARLDWRPEPVVVAAGSRHRSTTTVALDDDTDLVWAEQVVLGRSGERPGHLVSTLRIERAGRVLVHHALDTAAWQAPSVGAGHRATGMVVLVGEPAARREASTAPDLVVRRLAEDVTVAVAVADDALGLARRLVELDPGPGAIVTRR